MDGEPVIVFFDGVCGLCSHIVDWLMVRDRQMVFLYAPLQGTTATQRLPAADRENLNSIVILKSAQFHRRSDAIVEILRSLGGQWRTLGQVLSLVPRPLRDFGYRVVASQRYRIWGKHDTCRIPTPAERKRFLD